MMYKNTTGIPLSLAVWLAHDDYDHNPDVNHISATTLLKSIKQIVLGTRITASSEPEDIANLVQARVGTAIHNEIEKAWKTNYVTALHDLGYPEKIIKNIVINPPKDIVLKEDALPIYFEQRSEKTVNGITISGKFDCVIDGRVEDFKSTSTFTYINKSNDKKYILQGSIYRWLNPDIITQDHMVIQFIFMDWKPMQALSSKDYPQSRTLEYKLPLMSVAETDTYINNKIAKIKQYMNEPESGLPACSDEDLWRREPVFKYYKNPAKMTRSTKNFKTLSEAQIRVGQDGSVGTIVEVKGEVVACRYCNAKNICIQKNTYLLDNTLKL